LKALSLLILFLYGGSLLSALELDPVERCNNTHRLFCRTERQAKAVDAELLNMKSKGYHITKQMIRHFAQKHLSTPPK